MARAKKEKFPTELRVSIGGDEGEDKWFEARDNSVPLHENQYDHGQAIAIYQLTDLRKVSKTIKTEKA